MQISYSKSCEAQQSMCTKNVDTFLTIEDIASFHAVCKSGRGRVKCKVELITTHVLLPLWTDLFALKFTDVFRFGTIPTYESLGLVQRGSTTQKIDLRDHHRTGGGSGRDGTEDAISPSPKE